MTKVIDNEKIREAYDRIEKLQAISKAENVRLSRIAKMSWIKQLQEPEFIENLKLLEEHQESAFYNMIKREKWNISKEEQRNFFISFFNELLKEKVKNMRQFMLKEGFKFNDS